MDISIFLAQVFGLYFVIIGAALLIRPNAIPTLMKLMGTSSSIYVSGFIALFLGVPLVLIHNVWDGSWRVIITILVWLTLLKGIARVYAPEMVANWTQALGRNVGLIKLLVWGMMVFGIYLLYIGFGM